MTQEQLLKHLQYCKWLWNGYGEDVFQEACLIALQRYNSLDNVNQNLFGFLCKEAARKLLRHRKFEITFSQITQSYFDGYFDEKNFEDTLADPRSTEALDALTDDYDFEEAHDDNFVSFTDKKQLPPFQLHLTFFTNL